jgi:hypothetical protein
MVLIVAVLLTIFSPCLTPPPDVDHLDVVGGGLTQVLSEPGEQRIHRQSVSVLEAIVPAKVLHFSSTCQWVSGD